MEKQVDKLLLVGDEKFIQRTLRALQLIRATGEKWYVFIKENIGIIKMDQQSGIRVYTHPPVFEVGERTWSSSSTWYSSCIVHDANHSFLYRQGKRHSGRDAERACMELQLEYLQACGAPAHEIGHLTRLYQTDYDYYSSSTRDW